MEGNTQVGDGDEAALIDSFFLPGGILDPQLEDEEGRPSAKDSSMNSNHYENGWSTPQLQMTAEPQLDLPVWNDDRPSENYLPQKQEPWTNSTNGRDPNVTESLFADPTPVSTAYHDVLQRQSSTGSQQNNSLPQLFSQGGHNFLEEEEERSSNRAHDPGRGVIPSLGLPPTGTALPPPPGLIPQQATLNDTQKEEDMRQMILALSSSLNNSADLALMADHLKSPPKIVRRSSASHPTSIPLELPAGGDYFSATSSLSSDSAESSSQPSQARSHPPNEYFPAPPPGFEAAHLEDYRNEGGQVKGKGSSPPPTPSPQLGEVKRGYNQEQQLERLEENSKVPAKEGQKEAAKQEKQQKQTPSLPQNPKSHSNNKQNKKKQRKKQGDMIPHGGKTSKQSHAPAYGTEAIQNDSQQNKNPQPLSAEPKKKPSLGSTDNVSDANLPRSTADKRTRQRQEQPAARQAKTLEPNSSNKVQTSTASKHSRAGVPAGKQKSVETIVNETKEEAKIKSANNKQPSNALAVNRNKESKLAAKDTATEQEIITHQSSGGSAVPSAASVDSSTRGLIPGAATLVQEQENGGISGSEIHPRQDGSASGEDNNGTTLDIHEHRQNYHHINNNHYQDPLSSQPTPFLCQSTVIPRSILFCQHLAQFFALMLSCMMLEASKEGMEQPDIAAGYVLMYSAPFFGRLVISYLVYVPHFFPGISLGAALVWVCRSNKKTSSDTKRDHSVSTSSEGDILRIAESRAYEERLCRRILNVVQWCLPSLALVEAMVHSVPSSHIRLLVFYALSMLRTSNLLSPLGWTSGSLQLLLVVLGSFSTSTRNKHGIDFLIACLGLATLRYLRIGPNKRDFNSSTINSTSRTMKRKYR